MELYRDKQEVWKDIIGYEGYYQASNYGNIRSVKREITQKGHKQNYTRIMNSKILQPRLQNSNYYIVPLSVNGIRSMKLVHRLITETFIPNLENKLQVNHIDGNKLNNKIENLEWCSRSENVRHSHRIIGRKTFTKPIKCIELNQRFSSIINASRETGINRSSISHALNGIAKTAGGYTWKFM